MKVTTKRRALPELFHTDKSFHHKSSREERQGARSSGDQPCQHINAGPFRFCQVRSLTNSKRCLVSTRCKGNKGPQRLGDQTRWRLPLNGLFNWEKSMISYTLIKRSIFHFVFHISLPIAERIEEQ